MPAPTKIPRASSIIEASEPSPLNLPVLSATVSPEVFFAAGPLMLFLIYLYLVHVNRMLARAARQLYVSAGSSGLSPSMLAPLSPALQQSIFRLLAPHLVIGVFLSALVRFNPEQTVSLTLLITAIAGWSLWGAVALVKRRGQSSAIVSTDPSAKKPTAEHD